MMKRAEYYGAPAWGWVRTPRWAGPREYSKVRHTTGAGDEVSEEDHLTARAYSFASIVWNRIGWTDVLWGLEGRMKLAGGGVPIGAGPLAHLRANTMGDLDPRAGTRIREVLRQVSEAGMRGDRLDRKDVRDAVQAMQMCTRRNIPWGMAETWSDDSDQTDPARRAAERILGRWCYQSSEHLSDMRGAWPYWVMEIEYTYAAAGVRPMLYHDTGWWLCKRVVEQRFERADTRDDKAWWSGAIEAIGADIRLAKEEARNNLASLVPCGKYFWVRDPLGRVIPRRPSGQLRWLGGRTRASRPGGAIPGANGRAGERPAA